MRDVIEHLELHWRGRERITPAHEMRLEAMLNGVDLRPSGLPPQAIFVIREVRGLPPLTSTNISNWLTSLQSEIDRQYRTTVRPDQQDARRASSVVFRDPATMLTCLVQDAARGQTSHWYWRRLAGGTGITPGRMLVRVAMGHVRYLPAAISDAPVKDAVAAVSLMDHLSIHRILTALQHQYHLPSMKWPDAADLLRGPETRRPRGGAGSSGFEWNDDTPQEAAPIWRRWLPPLPSAPPLIELLIGLCATLDHAPGLARRASFSAETEVWLAVSKKDDLSERKRSEIHGIGDGFKASSTLSEPVSAHDPIHPLAGVSEEERTETQRIGDAFITPTTPSDSPTGNDPARGAVDLPDDERTPTRRISPLFDGVSTRLGGVFYLLNLMKWLDLPHDWQAEQVSPWDVLTGVSLALLGEDAPPDDALWEWFAERGGRDPEDPIGAGLEVPIDYRLPVDWLERFTVGQLDSTFEPTIRLPITDGMRDWLGVVSGYMRSLLMEKTGTPDLNWLLKPAHVQATRTHLDIYFSLEVIDIGVRRGGLDLNPEWLPDFGCIVHFYYQDAPQND
jgi:hypothetical protein